MASEAGKRPDEPSLSEPDIQTDEQELRDAVRAAYQAFRSYKLHDRVEGCPCCVSESAERELRARPLHEIEGDAFGYYVWKAMATWGDVGDFKHFLPRILELLALDPTEFCGTDIEIAIGKLGYAKWNSWPEEERAPIIRFFHAWWRRELHVVRERAQVNSKVSPNSPGSFPNDVALRNELLDDVPAHVRKPEVAALELVSELQVIETQQMQNSGLQIVDVHAVFDGIEA